MGKGRATGLPSVRDSGPARYLERETPPAFFATVQEAAAQEVARKANMRVRATIVALNADKTKADIRRDYMPAPDGIFYPIEAQFQQFAVGDRVVADQAKGGLIVRARLKKPSDKTVDDVVHRDGSKALTGNLKGPDFVLSGGGSLGAVKAGGLDDDSLAGWKIRPWTIYGGLIVDDAIWPEHVLDSSLEYWHLASYTIQSWNYAPSSVNVTAIAPSAVTPGRLDRAYAAYYHGHGSHYHTHGYYYGTAFPLTWYGGASTSYTAI